LTVWIVGFHLEKGIQYIDVLRRLSGGNLFFGFEIIEYMF
jgi:hypothetical protein